MAYRHIIERGISPLNIMPTMGNNPWVDGVTYNGKLVTNQTRPGDSLVPGASPVLVNVALPSEAKLPLSLIQESDGMTERIVPWTRNLMSAYLKAFSEWSRFANIKFTVSDPSRADIQYYRAVYKPEENMWAGSHQKIESSIPQGFPQISTINANHFNETTPVQKGKEFLNTAIHEIGHGIGLKHPHDQGGGTTVLGIFPGLVPDDASGQAGYGLYELNQGVHTIMSYINGSAKNADGSLLTKKAGDPLGNVATPMALDIMAAQLRYGYNPNTAAEDNIYLLPTKGIDESTYWETIYDTNGLDVLSAKKASGNVVINLQAARMNAYRFQEKEMSESYNFSNASYSDIYQKMVEILAPHGGLLGSATLFAATVEDTVSIIESREGSGWLRRFYDNALSDSNQNLGKALNDTISYISKERELITRTNPFFASKVADAMNLQNALLQESAMHVAGYMNQQIGTAGGFFIAAGTTIENAIGGKYHDSITGNYFNNFIRGLKGDDNIYGLAGNDTIRAGAGHDTLDGGIGSDLLYGGPGRNTYSNNKDGSPDHLFILSEYKLNSTGQSDIINHDIVTSLGVEDSITILGTTTDQLSIRQLSDGLGIFASGSLEAIVTDSSWNAASLANNVFGDATRFI
jgi:Ca2+-binding RTX toxin-like protein